MSLASPRLHSAKRLSFGWRLTQTPCDCRMQRANGRAPEEIRPISFEIGVAQRDRLGLGGVGNTRVICSAMIEETVPRWMKEQGVTGGWLTAEYSMLPYSTNTRKPRDITQGQARRPQQRNSAPHRTFAARGGRSRKARRPDDVGRLRCAPGRGGTRTAAITGASWRSPWLVGGWRTIRRSAQSPIGSWSPRSASACSAASRFSI